MVRTQIQLPSRLHRRLRAIAANRESSLTEIIRQGMEQFADTCVDEPAQEKVWRLPLLPASGGFRGDPAKVAVEAEAIEKRAE